MTRYRSAISVPGRKRPSSAVCDCSSRPEEEDGGRLVVPVRGAGVALAGIAIVSDSTAVMTGAAQDGQNRAPAGTWLSHFAQCGTGFRSSVPERSRQLPSRAAPSPCCYICEMPPDIAGADVIVARPAIVAFEGIDGSGKSTQAALLYEWLKAEGAPVRHISFPRVSERGYGEAIAMFLRGEFGSLAQVHPWLVASLFAGDRASAVPAIRQSLDEGCLVLADRYFYSNLAYQAAKIPGQQAKCAFASWLEHVEFACNRIPRAHLNLFFNVPAEFALANVSRRAAEQRSYLQGQNDIHEVAGDFQQQVVAEYRRFGALDPSFVTLDCAGEHGEMRGIDTIQQQLRQALATAGILRLGENGVSSAGR